MADCGRKWGISMFMGEFHHNIDDKGRLIIPAKFREELGSEFIVTRGIENCLFIYSKKEWQKIVDQLNTLPFTKKDARSFIRFFLSGATTAELDKQGRIHIASPLISYANLTKECIIIGTGERLEVWSEKDWNDFFDSAKDNMSDIAENLFDGSVSI